MKEQWMVAASAHTAWLLTHILRVAYSGPRLQVNAKNRPNLTKASFLFQAFITLSSSKTHSNNFSLQEKKIKKKIRNEKKNGVSGNLKSLYEHINLLKMVI